jgi:hypothetical protein
MIQLVVTPEKLTELIQDIKEARAMPVFESLKLRINPETVYVVRDGREVVDEKASGNFRVWVRHSDWDDMRRLASGKQLRLKYEGDVVK